MELIENKLCNLNKFMLRFSLHRINPLKLLILFFLGIYLTACSDFIEADPPKNILISETVFNDPSTVESALANIYYNMREQGMISGNFGLTPLLGIYGDELDYYGFNADYAELYFNNVNATNTTILNWWSQAYNLIYNANDIIKGVEGSSGLTAEEKSYFKGQALFVRGYIHSLLVNLYGDIPYIKTTNYIENNSVSRLPLAEVNVNIIEDLVMAIELLENEGDASEEKVLPGQSAAKALLARMYLYNENWGLAESTASQLINNYNLEPNLNDVFLKESSETIWQLKPGITPKNTQEAVQLIIQFIPGQRYALTNSLLAAFESGDQRLTQWTESISNTENTITLFFAHKYKANLTETERLEYSIIFRLAEQYLIRAEARAHLGNILGSQQDVNVIRNRAGLENTTANTVNNLLDAILKERQVELFTEQGHRWFDLKRTDNANNVLSIVKPYWQATDILLPIPETELEINPNLLPQNSGY
ncbi:RagB/SusD family nutrient uptake outer membrane protein [Subsaxibacter sp. CAU 1640]|uniref:RagB/SusD family nutrient uptake outer membrane protein n=1 Tax=Subsaxibacter sp. CAU 1640 TaxID=2933271 RepID=UPI0020036C5D|nr:RagB/SusD family nutrient uptake outer membrane protein [Subsaxibacter sp. CAU 1640]MCK7591276.1 RagB/SusD family nutrient uptake outer membrane protein [Subsaxibacter sp. CAU 1640]